jgi:hypothetical protein
MRYFSVPTGGRKVRTRPAHYHEKGFLEASLASICAIVLCVAASADENQITAEILAPKYQAKPQHRLWDGTSVDLLSKTHAYEVEWASHKVYEAVGQAVYYGLQTHRQPGIILITRDPRADMRYIYRCKVICAHLGIPVYVEEVSHGL